MPRAGTRAFGGPPVPTGGARATEEVEIIADPSADPLLALLVGDDRTAEVWVRPGWDEPGPSSSPAVRLIRAETPEDACALLRHMTVDAVLLDLSPPREGWVEALRGVHASASGAPVLTLLGGATDQTALQAIREGAQDCITEPVEGAALRRILLRARERERAHQATRSRLRVADEAVDLWRLLAEIGSVLTRPVDTGQGVADVARLVVPAAARCFVAFLVPDEETPGVFQVAHADPARERELAERVRDFLDSPYSSSRLVHALDLGAVTSIAAASERLRPFLRSLKIPYGAAYPLQVGSRIQGLLILDGVAGRGDAPGPVLGRWIAEWMGSAVERARRMQRARRAVGGHDLAVGVVAHELRNLIGTVEVCAQALLDPEPAPPSGTQGMARLIQRSVDSMRLILDDFMDRARIDAGHFDLQRQSIAVSDLVSAARQMFEPLAAEQGVGFRTEFEGGLPRVHADPHRILQVLSNLLGNAVKFTPAGGNVILSVSLEKGEGAQAEWPGVRFTVTDTGPGIAQDELAHVFDWFWQSPSMRQRRGSGLGLSIARDLVEAHGSRLHAESEPGKGATFWFTLSAAGQEA